MRKATIGSFVDGRGIPGTAEIPESLASSEVVSTAILQGFGARSRLEFNPAVVEQQPCRSPRRGAIYYYM